MDQNGRIFDWLTAPPAYNPSGKSNLVIIPQQGYLREIIDPYAKRRVELKHGITNMGPYKSES